MRDDWDHPNIAARLLNEPLLIHPDKAETITAFFLRRQGVEVNVANVASFINEPKASVLRERQMVERSYEPFLFDQETGIAIIEIKGSLAHKKGFIGASSGVMGYDGISAAFNAAVEAPDVKGIIFDIHSGGGEVAGAFQLADRIAAARGIKPMIALADEMAFSAAYLIAAAADEIWLAADTAHVGSVGVVMVHFSMEEMLANEGVKPTIIQAGAQKADGNPYKDLPEDVRDRFQGTIDAIHTEFVTRVAAWRGLTDAAVRKTEAGVFMGADAVNVGFANGIADPFVVFDALADEVKNQSAPTFAFAM